VIDCELRLPLAIRRMIREEEGQTPNSRRIDQLLDERAAAERQGSAGTGSAQPAPEQLTGRPCSPPGAVKNAVTPPVAGLKASPAVESYSKVIKIAL